MGCDIHIVTERRRKSSGLWVGIYSTDLMPGRRIKCAQRDYEFFAEIAGVRGSSATTIYARNLPEDVSELAWQQYMRAPTDHHTPSYLTVKEFCDAWFRVNGDRADDIRREFAEYDLLGTSSDEGDFDFRVVFWFDN